MMFNQELLKHLGDGVGFDSALWLPLFDNIELSEESAHFINYNIEQNNAIHCEFPFDARFPLAALNFVNDFSIKLTLASTRMLPDCFRWNNPDGRENFISIDDLIRKWKNNSDHVRIEIGRMLATMFHPLEDEHGKPVDVNLDAYDQPIERVLPLHYGKWILKKAGSNRPNCLGKLQLLIALGKKFGVKTLALSPLKFRSALSNRYRSLACAKIIDLIITYNIPLSDARMESLATTRDFPNKFEKDPPFQHFSVGYQLPSLNWLIVDPGSGIASLAPAEHLLSETHKTLVSVQHSAPMASIQKEHPQDIKRLEESLEKVFKACGKFASLNAEFAGLSNWRNLLNFALQHDLISEFLLEDDQIQTTQQTLVREFEHEMLLYLGKAYKKEAFDLRNLTSDQFQRVKETFCYQYLLSGEKEILDHSVMDKAKATAFHPLVEISLPDFRAACATISHVAYCISEVVGQQTEEILMSFGLAEGMLYNVALGCESSRRNNNALRALELLKSRTHHGFLASRLLKGN